MPTTSIDHKRLYSMFMEEIKLRIDLITATRKEQFELPRGAAYELCYLQLRIVCELIGMACLCAHGDIPTTKKPAIQSLFKPGQIFAELERLNPDYFPRPGLIIRDKSDAIVGLRPVEKNSLSKDDLKVLYDQECNEVLHWGTMKQPRYRRPMRDFGLIEAWERKIIDLLDVHYIRLVTPKTHLWVRMAAKEANGKVGVQLVEASWTGFGPEPSKRAPP